MPIFSLSSSPWLGFTPVCFVVVRQSPLSLLLAGLNKPTSSNLFLQGVSILPDTSYLFPAFAPGPWLIPSLLVLQKG